MPQMQAGDRKSARLQEDEMHMRVPVLLHLWGEVAWVPPRAHSRRGIRQQRGPEHEYRGRSTSPAHSMADWARSSNLYLQGNHGNSLIFCPRRSQDCSPSHAGGLLPVFSRLAQSLRQVLYTGSEGDKLRGVQTIFGHFVLPFLLPGGYCSLGGRVYEGGVF